MTEPDRGSQHRRVAVVGGGLAGLAAAVRLAEQGLRVEVFEARPRLGGRAASFLDPRSGQWIDRCQHVSMGCCTELADLCRRTGLADCFQRHHRLHFFGPDGTRCDFAPAAWLPAPLHLLPALFRLRYLSWKDRLHIVRTMFRLAREKGERRKEEGVRREELGVRRKELEVCTPEFPPCSHLLTPNSYLPTPFGSWLRSHGESDAAIDGFWSVVLRGALAETVDRASLVAARKVFVDGFLASRRAYELEISRIPLAEMFDTRLGQWLAERRAAVHRGCRVRQIEGDGRRAAALVLPDGMEPRREFDYFVLAVPWHRVTKLLAGPLVDAIPALRDSAQIEPVPITAIHLWFDRPITELPHAVLVGRLSQWVFADQFGGTGVSPVRRRSTGETPVPPDEPERLHHYQVVISGSQDLSQRRREDVLAQVQSELEAIWPAARTAQLVRWRMVTEPAAAFSMRPGIDRLRPPQETPVANLAICGDWTATGWPATMEGAVRSGYAAAEVIQKAVEENNE